MPDFSYLFDRRNSFYTLKETSWNRARQAYEGGAQYIETALIKHISEVDIEYEERISRAIYFNYPRRISKLISHYIMSESPIRTNGSPEIIEDFNRSGLRTDEFIRQTLAMLNIYGMAWVGVDMPSFVGEIDMEIKQKAKIRPYAVNFSPLEVHDWAYGSDGQLDWLITAETQVRNADPYTLPVTIEYRRLWTRSEWLLLARSDSGAITVEASGKNPIGEVPFIRIEDVDGYGISAGHWFEDVVRISDSILNHESEAQQNIIKQMFGLLVIPDSFLYGQKKTETEVSDQSFFAKTISRSIAITETSEESGISRYIAPDGVETQVIASEINRLKVELHSVIGLAMAKRGNGAETAESKAWDFQDVQMFLATRADAMEQAENKIWILMSKWDNSIKVPEVSYNRQFAMYDLLDMVNAVLQLSTVPAGKEFEKHIYRMAVKLSEKISRLSPQQRTDIDKEIEAGEKQLANNQTPDPLAPDNAGDGNV